MSVELPTPKAFISYAWTSESHLAWVMELATRLQQDGIEVKLDRWDLSVGHDKYAYMESMVTDPSVTKVLMICDSTYQRKADHREGGVGTETQVITPELYKKTAQEKYAAIIVENDAHGEPCVPTFAASRLYIDFTRPEEYEVAFEDLTRWLFNRPRYVKPPLGKPPAFLTDPEAASTSTMSSFRRADSSIRSGSASSAGHIADFGDIFIAELRDRQHDTRADPIDEAVKAAAASMRPALRNLIGLIASLARYPAPGFERILTIFEQLASLMFRPGDMHTYNNTDYDPYRIIAYEGFLSMTALLIREKRFDLLGEALSATYITETSEFSTERAGHSFTIFNQNVASYEILRSRTQSRQYDLFADDIWATYKMGNPRSIDLMEADVVLFLRASIVEHADVFEGWWPRLIIYTPRGEALGLFLRLESLRTFADVAPQIFGPISVDDFKKRLLEIGPETFRHFGIRPPNIFTLTQANKLGSKP